MAIPTEVLLVSPTFLKRVTQLNSSVDEDYIIPAVILAQDLHIQPLLGTKLLKAIQTKVSADNLTGVYATLVDLYVRKATAWWTMVELLPNLHVRLDNGMLAIRTSEGSTSITQADLQRELDRARSNAEFYSYRCLRYLQQNSSSFEELSSNQGPEMQPYQAGYFQNGMEISGPQTLSDIYAHIVLPVNG